MRIKRYATLIIATGITAIAALALAATASAALSPAQIKERLVDQRNDERALVAETAQRRAYFVHFVRNNTRPRFRALFDPLRSVMNTQREKDAVRAVFNRLGAPKPAPSASKTLISATRRFARWIKAEDRAALAETEDFLADSQGLSAAKVEARLVAQLAAQRAVEQAALNRRVAFNDLVVANTRLLFHDELLALRSFVDSSAEKDAVSAVLAKLVGEYPPPLSLSKLLHVETVKLGQYAVINDRKAIAHTENFLAALR